MDKIDKEISKLEKELGKVKRIKSSKKPKKKISKINEEQTTDIYGLENDLNKIKQNKKLNKIKIIEELNECEKTTNIINNESEQKIKLLANLIAKAKNNKSTEITSDNELNNVLEIDCSKIVEKESYNDYMIFFNKPTKIIDINPSKCIFNKNTMTNITSDNNSLLLEINNNEVEIELDIDYYNRYELVDSINEGLKLNAIPILCMLNQDDIFQFKSSDNKNFIMKNNEKSILSIIGFKKNTYINNNNYIAEKANNLADNIFYIVFENIYKKPLFYINLDDNIINKINCDDMVNCLDDNYENLIIKFYKTKNELMKNDIGYSFFFEHKHILNLHIE